MDLKRRPDGSMSPDTKELITGAAIGAVIGMPLPVLTWLTGGLIGGAIAAYRIHKRRG
ncbi:hypothetical protein SCH01S_21_00660 [Sphingomonas changbaiensis NBRC 104936]|uniref:Uncharacterized protein n=1 Tax=Sphingomonas changbaiensis NBRC 104936 TaxID=1219043 RepID=A0A0E9MMY1_9SPHN|nr:hypothetical protein [Sphingomonas changbaiensis]GAO38879.1 hypothetical protein SCH01S_21_00660 [Sphingomonas changbaiensis NBRC 104936]